jgi:hypothetical protein
MLPVGKSIAVFRDGDRLVADMKFSGDAFAQRVRRQVDEGVMIGSSVGFLPGLYEHMKDGSRGIRFTENTDLMEWSWAPVQANPDARLIGIGKDAAEIERAALRARAAEYRAQTKA